MIDLKKLDWSEIEKLTETLPEGCFFEKHWADGIQSHTFSAPPRPNREEVVLENVSDIANYLGVKSKYVYREKENEICECIFFIPNSNDLSVAYNTEIMGHTKLLYGRVYLGILDELIVFTEPDEVENFKKQQNWKKLKEGLKIDKEFLADPWKEYRAKKKKYEEKIKKVEEATKKKIEETKERVKELEKAINDLETEFLSEIGIKENREGN